MRYGLHMISPSIERSLTLDQDETNDVIEYDFIYSSIVEHRFVRSLFLPVELKVFNRSNEQVRMQLQLIR
jgi:hypothetical protein